jgi:signal transduction histidine kinase
VRVALRDVDGFCELEVSNEGRAIPPDLLPNVFHPFRRGPHPQGERNIGLGLYIVEQIAKAHGGSVSVRSNDEVTQFAVRFPKRELEPRAGIPVH